MEMERREYGRSQRNKIPGIYVTKEWKSRKAYKRKNKKSNDSDEKNMEKGYLKKIIEEEQ